MAVFDSPTRGRLVALRRFFSDPRGLAQKQRTYAFLVLGIAFCSAPSTSSAGTQFFQTQNDASAAAYAAHQGDSPPHYYHNTYGPFYGRICPQCGDYGQWVYVNAIIVDANYYAWPLQACKPGEQFVVPGTCKSTCPIQLSIPSPDAYPFDLNTLDPDMQSRYQCLVTAVAEFGGHIVTTGGSTHRPPSYQQHLIEVWKKYWEIDALSADEKESCAAVIAQVEQEFGSQGHGLGNQEPSRTSRHQCSPAAAFDVTVVMPSGSLLDPRIDFSAFGCELDRFNIIKDPWHFQESKARRFQGEGLPCK